MKTRNFYAWVSPRGFSNLGFVVVFPSKKARLDFLNHFHGVLPNFYSRDLTRRELVSRYLDFFMYDCSNFEDLLSIFDEYILNRELSSCEFRLVD